MFQKYLDKLGYDYTVDIVDGMLPRVNVTPDGIVRVNPEAHFSNEDIEGLYQHELEGHVGRRYYGYMEQRIKAMHELMHLLDYTMPGIRDQFLSWRESNGKDKLADFCEKYWHYDNITCMSEAEFIDDYYKLLLNYL